MPGAAPRLIVVTSTTTCDGPATRSGELAGTGTQIVVHGSRYTEARPSRWWSRRDDIRYLMSEMHADVSSRTWRV